MPLVQRIRSAKSCEQIRDLLRAHVSAGGKIGRGVDRAARRELSKRRARKCNDRVTNLQRLFGIG